MSKLFHRIMHFLGLYNGYCDAFYDGEKLMMSFVCTTCGKRTGIHCVDKLIDKLVEVKESEV